MTIGFDTGNTTILPSPSALASAVALKHVQNTDIGTTSATFTCNGIAVILEGDPRLITQVFNLAAHEFYIKDEPLVINSGELLTIGSDNTALVWCDSNKATATTLIEYITRQVIVRDEPFIIDYGTVAVIGYDGTASVWCDSNRFWDRSNNGFQTLVDLNINNLYIVANNEILDLVADDPVNRHLDQATLDRGAIWIR